MKKLKLNEEEIVYTITYDSRRTTLLLLIENDQLQIRSPHGVNLQAIESIIQQKSGWVLSQLKLYTENTYTENSKLLFLGQNLQITFGEKSDYDQQSIYLSVDKNQQEAVYDWYQEQAKEYLPTRLLHWAKRLGKQPTKIRIRAMKTRWGSCSSKGSISLNWRLMKAPIAVIDHVLIHEVAHLVEMNHSTSFWYLVSTLQPDYLVQRQWLKENAQKLLVD